MKEVDVHDMKYGKLGEEEETISNNGPHTGSVSFNIPAKWIAIGVK
jgi:hypothetical protein